MSGEDGYLIKQAQRATIAHLGASMSRKVFFPQQFRVGCTKQICSRAGNSKVNGQVWRCLLMVQSKTKALYRVHVFSIIRLWEKTLTLKGI